MEGIWRDCFSVLLGLLSCPKQQQYSETKYENCLQWASYAGDTWNLLKSRKIIAVICGRWLLLEANMQILYYLWCCIIWYKLVPQKFTPLGPAVCFPVTALKNTVKFSISVTAYSSLLLEHLCQFLGSDHGYSRVQYNYHECEQAVWKEQS
jgi:hypothetical protein